ncbi:MAG: prolyl oligopeptidase family serine peptidase [Bacteroidota bacterium]
MEYPLTKKVDTVDNYFGVNVPDPYRWLEYDTAADVAGWVQAQNEVTFGYLEKIPFRDQIRNRLTEVWNFPKQTIPFKKGNNYFFYKNDGLQNQYVLYVQEGLDGNPSVLLDPNKMSDDGTVALSGLSFSKDGKLMAYSVSTGGSDWKEIFVMNVETGEQLEDHILWVKFSGISWYENGFYYSGFNQPAPGSELTVKNEYHKLFYHHIGTSQEQDELIMDNPSVPSRMFYASTTEDERFLVVYEENAGSRGHLMHIRDHNKSEGFVTLVDEFGDDYNVIGNVDSRLYIRTNAGAPKNRLVMVDINNPEQEKWQEIIPEGADVMGSVTMAADKLVISFMKDAHSELKIYDYDGKYLYDILLPALGTVDGFTGYRDDQTAFYTFTSFTYPNVIYRYNFGTGVSEKYFEPDISFNGNDYETKQVFYKSKDGTDIPMFIVYKKGISLDGTNPTLLYGYGGFNISMTPGFKISRIIWLENGGVYAMACLRGGGEYGEDWHQAGTKLNKQNVFDDFISAAEYLIDEGYTSPEKLAVQGGSNGGLLVGACINQRPELFRVALPAVGVMDMLRFQKFTIGSGWVSDYGSSDDSTQFHYIYGYSPLHNIKEDVEYPSVLVTTADHDDRVVPAHSFKYIATLQEKYKGKNPVLIRVDVMAGHGAGKPTAKQIDEATDIYSFLFYNMGVNSICMGE